MNVLGVVGAGTMGAGIAQLGCVAGYRTLLHDPVPDALARGGDSVRSGLEKGLARGRYGAEEAAAAAGRLRECPALEDLAPCGLVIEAAPERAELKRELFARLSQVCGEDTILASNTSESRANSSSLSSMRSGAASITMSQGARSSSAGHSRNLPAAAVASSAP